MDNPGKSAPLVIGFVGQLPFLVQYSSIFFVSAYMGLFGRQKCCPNKRNPVYQFILRFLDLRGYFSLNVSNKIIVLIIRQFVAVSLGKQFSSADHR